MDVEQAGCYKLYRCRSSLACDSGGTVYDRSHKLEEADDESPRHTAHTTQSDSGLLENIIYIIGKDNNNMSNNCAIRQSLSCLDSIAFGNNEPYSDMNGMLCQTVPFSENETVSEEDICKYYLVQYDDIDSTENSTTETLDSDGFDRENFEYYCDSSEPSTSMSESFVDSNHMDTVATPCSIFLCNGEEKAIKLERDCESKALSESENDAGLGSEIEATVKLTRKRKQSYKLKSYSLAELLEGHDSLDANAYCEGSSTMKRAAYYCDDPRNEQNPFENVRMSSILKKEHCANSQIRSRYCTRDTLPNNGSVDRENRYCQSNNSFVIASDNYFDKLSENTDLANADYLEYVQPREKVVESNMDKLLSPTIEVEMSTITKHCKTPPQVDCNGNEVGADKNLNTQSNILAAREAVEKQLVSKNIHAIKLGYQNLFNTSNECVVDEILFDRCAAYNDVRLEIDVDHVRWHSQTKVPLVLLENIDEYIAQHHPSADPFKRVSCSLQDTLNELEHCGEFAEDNGDGDARSNQRERVENETSNIDQAVNHCADSSTLQNKTAGYVQSKRPPVNSNFSVKMSPPNHTDINANYDSTKYPSNPSVVEKQVIAPLKMKIKRVSSDDNRYVIDESSLTSIQADNKTTSRLQRNPDSKYECSNCSKAFRTKKLLKSHISDNHKGPYDMECDICHMKSKKSSAHKKHELWCERSAALKCEVCQKVYCYKAVLLRHMKTHKA